MHMHRRSVVAAGAAMLSTPRALLAQPAKVWRIGVLLHDIRFENFRLRTMVGEVGLEEGRNFQWEVRSTGGQLDRLDSLAAELVAAKVDLIVAPNNSEIQAAKRATQTIPIVMMYAASPVESGLVASLARPGGNVTGTSTSAPELTGKMVEVLRDLLPRINRIAVLYEPDYPGMPAYQRSGERAAAAFGFKLETLAVRAPADVDSAFRLLERNRPDAIMVSMTGPVMLNWRRIVAFAAAERLPAIYSVGVPVSGGGLISYGPNFVALVRRTAVIVSKILKGTGPAEIPVEEPAEFELTINMKTANALGLTVPQALLMRAKLIE